MDEKRVQRNSSRVTVKALYFVVFGRALRQQFLQAGIQHRRLLAERIILQVHQSLNTGLYIFQRSSWGNNSINILQFLPIPIPLLKQDAFRMSQEQDP